MAQNLFKFKQFNIDQTDAVMKVGTDGVLLGAWTHPQQALNILDIGIGTGLITLMMAQNSSHKTNIDGVEIDEQSFLIAQRNITASPWSDRINLYHISIQDYLFQSDQKYDLIVSNPPFFSGGTLSDSQERTDVRHTIKLPHGDLLRSVRGLLAPTGRFTMILPRIEGLRFIEMATSYGLYCSKKTRVFPHPKRSVERLLLEFTSNLKEKMIEKDFYLQADDTHRNYSKEYRELTKDFYLNF